MTNPLDEAIFDSGAPPEETRSSRRQMQRQRRRGPLRSVVLLLALALVGGGAFAGYRLILPVYESLTATKDFDGPGSGEATIVVKDGDTGTAIGRTLAAAGVVKTSEAFYDAATANATAAAAIQPGTYRLKLQMKASDALVLLSDAANRDVKHVTIREGLWVSEVFAALSQGSGLPVSDYEAAAKDAAGIGLPAVAKGNVEGWLYPETYDMNEASAKTAVGQLKVMIAATKAQLDAAGVAEADYQTVLTVASITEAEARAAVDLGKVARVVENRLDNPAGPTVGRLEMDSTVNYALKKRGLLTKTEFDSAKSNPYDTYGHRGLPPGPIGSPGAASIKAAANPTPGPWFFFVTVNLDSGLTKFATTLSEHNTNVAELNSWCAANTGKCSG